MNAIYLSMYFVATLLVCVVMAQAFRRSAAGVLLVATLIWFLIGACLYPIVDLLGVVERGTEVRDFISRNGEPAFGAALHILLAAVGMAVGYAYRPRDGISERAVRAVASSLSKGNDKFIWRASILLGIASYLVYFKLVGFDLALINAAAARSGDFDGFGEKDAYLFIKTVAAIGFVATSFLPIVLLGKKGKIFLLLYGLLVVMAYSNSISRNLLLYGAIVPVLVYMRLKWDVMNRKSKFSSLLLASILIPFALLVLNYGKIMGHYISATLSGEYYSLATEVGEIDLLESIFSNFGFQWVSVQAGIDHFLRTGMPLVTQEPFLATFFGAIPSRVLSAFGADFLYYGAVKVKLACINSEAFGYVECTVPPLAIGYAAYLLPGAGAFLIGYVWLRLFGALERMWLHVQANNLQKLWIPYFLWGTVVNFLTFIPSTLALAVTQFLWLFLLSHLRFRFRFGTQRKKVHVAQNLPQIQAARPYRLGRPRQV